MHIAYMHIAYSIYGGGDRPRYGERDLSEQSGTGSEAKLEPAGPSLCSPGLTSPGPGPSLVPTRTRGPTGGDELDLCEQLQDRVGGQTPTCRCGSQPGQTWTRSGEPSLRTESICIPATPLEDSRKDCRQDAALRPGRGAGCTQCINDSVTSGVPESSW